jgi:uncharacterized protein (TIGR03437 family)
MRMWNSFHRSLVLFAGAPALIAFAQVTLVGPTYLTLDLPRLAPGQGVTLAFAGFTSRFPEPLRASGSPLPNTLGGISIALRQFINSDEIPVPMESISQSACTDAAPQCSPTTFITIQIPFELFLPPLGSRAPVAPASLTITERGSKYAPISFLPVSDAIHIVNTCDTTGSAGNEHCEPGVIHADGSPVNADNPARVGEALSVFAFGLGRVRPVVASGSATPPASYTLETPIDLRFAFGPNLPPQRDSGSPSRDPIVPEQNPPVANLLFVGLSPGSVGLYQLNIRVPSVPQNSPACGGDVRSNITITVIGTVSFDGVGICAVP